MRIDGRNADQLRSVKITPDFISTAEGSVLIELGNTRVICTATVDDGVPGFLKGSGKGWVTSEYGMLPRATEERTPREADARQTVRPHRRNSAPHWPIAARRHRPGSAGRTHRISSIAT